MVEREVRNQPFEVPAFDSLKFTDREADHCIVVPVLNEGERIRHQLQCMSRVALGADLVLVDGGSTDGALDPAFLELHGVRALLVKTGPGRLGAQLRAAFAWALGEGYGGVVTIDGNDKDGVEAVPRFVDALEAGFDFVQGSRFLPGGHHENTPLSRLLAIRFIHAPVVSVLAGSRYTDTTNGFRAYSTRLLTDARVQVFRNVFDAYELLPYLAVRAARVGMRVCEIPVAREYPADGPTPTKLHGIGAHAKMLRGLVDLARGSFNPTQDARGDASNG